VPLVEIAVLTSTEKVIFALELHPLDTKKFLFMPPQLAHNLTRQDIKQFEWARKDVVIFVCL
jgi:hypothetical protein